MRNLDRKSIAGVIKRLEKQDFMKLTGQELKKMDIYLTKDNNELLDIQMKKVVDSNYLELIKDAANLGIDTKKLQEICKDRDYSEVEHYLKEEQIIQNNKRIKLRQIAGRSCLEQNMFVTIIENIKDGKTQVVLSEEKLIEIHELMCKTTRSKWTKIGIKKFLLLVYNCEIDKNKKYIVKSLRMYHS